MQINISILLFFLFLLYKNWSHRFFFLVIIFHLIENGEGKKIKREELYFKNIYRVQKSLHNAHIFGLYMNLVSTTLFYYLFSITIKRMARHPYNINMTLNSNNILISKPKFWIWNPNVLNIVAPETSIFNPYFLSFNIKLFNSFIYSVS